MNNGQKSKIKSREVVKDRVIIVYKDGNVKSIDKEKYLNSLSEREKREFMLERL